MGITQVKNKLFLQLVLAVAFSRDMSNLWFANAERYLTSFATHVSYSRPYAETKNNGGERKVCMKWIQLGLGSDQVALKYQVSLSRSFLDVFVFLLMSQLKPCECFLVVL